MSSLGDAKGSNLKKYQELQNFAQPTRKLHYISLRERGVTTHNKNPNLNPRNPKNFLEG